MPLVLRDYQSDLVGTLRTEFKRRRSIVLQLPTGAGKTPIAGAIALGLSERGHGLLALEHRDELVDQFCRTLDTVGLSGRYGVIAAGRAPTPWARFQVASIQTLARRATPDLKPRYVVVDEAHHARAKTWAAVLDRFPDAKILGLTATPERLDGKPLGMHFEHLVCGPSIAWLVAHGWLAPTSLKYVGRGILTKDTKKTAGDYNRGELAEQITRKAIAAPVEAFFRYARDRQTIFFGINRADSMAVAEMLTARGVIARHVDGQTPKDQRRRHFEEFGAGRIQVLCNVDIAGEGTDISLCDCVMMGLPTLSVTRYLQQAGRAMRPDHGRDALILDLVGNFVRHGAPDLPRTWTLHGPEPGKKEASDAPQFNMRVCVHCATVYPSRKQHCPSCGQEQPMETPKHLDVELLSRALDTPMAAKPQSTMAEVRKALRHVIRTGGGRSGLRDIKLKYGMNDRWEQNAVDACGL